MKDLDFNLIKIFIFKFDCVFICIFMSPKTPSGPRPTVSLYPSRDPNLCFRDWSLEPERGAAGGRGLVECWTVVALQTYVPFPLPRPFEGATPLLFRVL